MALVSLRSSQIDEMARKSKGGAAVKRLTASSNRFLSAVQIGVTVAGFFSASLEPPRSRPRWRHSWSRWGWARARRRALPSWA